MPVSVREHKKIVSEANSLLSKLKVTKAPVPVKELARHLSLDVISYDLGENVSGVLIVKDGFGTIGFNPTDPEVRQRFTIAHELGHYILHRGSSNEQLFVDRNFIVKYRSANNYGPKEFEQEQEANAFAAELLMPKHLIQAELAKDDYDDLSETELIEKLAKIFHVSSVAMTYRLSNLNIYL